MSRFVHQGFLQRYPYQGIDLETHRISWDECTWYLDYKENSALSDCSGKCIRTIHLSELDNKLSTLKDWEEIKEQLCRVQVIVLLDDRQKVDNLIIKAYARRNLRVYMQLFLQEEKECLLADTPSS